MASLHRLTVPSSPRRASSPINQSWRETYVTVKLGAKMMLTELNASCACARERVPTIFLCSNITAKVSGSVADRDAPEVDLPEWAMRTCRLAVHAVFQPLIQSAPNHALLPFHSSSRLGIHVNFFFFLGRALGRLPGKILCTVISLHTRRIFSRYCFRA